MHITGQGTISLIIQSPNEEDLEWAHINNPHILNEGNYHEYVVSSNERPEDTVVVLEVQCYRYLPNINAVNPTDGVEDLRQQYYSKCAHGT